MTFSAIGRSALRLGLRGHDALRGDERTHEVRHEQPLMAGVSAEPAGSSWVLLAWVVP